MLGDKQEITKLKTQLTAERIDKDRMQALKNCEINLSNETMNSRRSSRSLFGRYAQGKIPNDEISDIKRIVDTLYPHHQ